MLIDQLRGYWNDHLKAKKEPSDESKPPLLNADTEHDLMRVLSSTTTEAEPRNDTDDDGNTSGEEEDAAKDTIAAKIMEPVAIAMPQAPPTAAPAPEHVESTPMAQPMSKSTKKRKRATGAPNWDKIHSKMFSEQRSIDVPVIEEEETEEIGGECSAGNKTSQAHESYTSDVAK